MAFGFSLCWEGIPGAATNMLMHDIGSPWLMLLVTVRKKGRPALMPTAAKRIASP